MTSFLDGPAAGHTLMLRRTPVYLRVVIDRKGKVDALDQLTDTPAAGETCHCYVLARKLGACHIRAGKGRSGFYPVAEYRYRKAQPDQKVMLSNRDWAEWVMSVHQPEDHKDEG